MPRPIPPLPPVTTATLPLKSNILALAIMLLLFVNQLDTECSASILSFRTSRNRAQLAARILDEVILTDGTTDGGTVQEFVARWARGLLQGRESRGRHHASGDRNRGRACRARLPDGRGFQVSRTCGRERGQRRIQPLLSCSE